LLIAETGGYSVLRSRSIIGLDIGSHQIKAIYLERKRVGWTVTAAGVAPTPAEAVSEGIIHEPGLVGDSIAALLRERNIPPGEAVAAISGSTVTVRQIRMPNVPTNALPKAVRFEAAKYLPSVQESTVEYAVLGKSGEPAQLDVLLVAAPNEMVNSRVEAIERAGLEPVAIDIEAFALLRSLSAAGFDLSEPIAVLNMGAAFTDFHILYDENIALTRSIPMGGAMLTQAIVSAANVTPEQAEALKGQLDLQPAPGSGALAFRPGGAQEIADEDPESRTADRLSTALPGLDMAMQVTMPFLDEILREVRRSLNFYHSQFPEGAAEANVTRLLLCGGTARMHGLAGFLEERLSVPVAVLDLFNATGHLAGVDVGGPTREWLRDRSADLAIATGLGLKAEG
jgi:type IV pilus assembly protein PilM